MNWKKEFLIVIIVETGTGKTYVYLPVNSELVLLYCNIGKTIKEDILELKELATVKRLLLSWLRNCLSNMVEDTAEVIF